MPAGLAVSVPSQTGGAASEASALPRPLGPGPLPCDPQLVFADAKCSSSLIPLLSFRGASEVGAQDWGCQGPRQGVGQTLTLPFPPLTAEGCSQGSWPLRRGPKAWDGA